MVYTSFVFIIFLALSALVYYLIPKKLQWLVLLGASLVFFVMSSKLLTLIMVLSTLTIYIGARLIQKKDDSFKAKKSELDRAERKILKAKINKEKKAILTTIVVINIAILAVMKYCNLFGSIVNSVGSLFGNNEVLPVFTIILPLGISYYTLMSISYIVDVYRGVIKAEANPLRLLLFVCYFPHIMEGPFDKYGALDKQFRQPHHFDYNTVKSGAILLLYGLFKKLVIADRAGLIVAGIFENTDTLSGTSIAIGVMLYTLQLYADFSGCIEIVTGASEIYGIEIAKNFNQPFFSRSINEFWRRWHITLGLWLKEYVFYPVSLSESFKRVNAFVTKHIKSKHFVKMIPAAYALFFVWFCNGLWHGASGKYVFYGLYYYILMMLGEFTKPFTDKLCNSLKINRENSWYHLFQMIRTFVIVNIGMLIFRSNTVSESAHLLLKVFSGINFFELINGTFTIKNITYKDYILLAICTIVIFVIGLIKEKGTAIRSTLITKPTLLQWVIYLIMIFAIIIFGIYGGNYGNATMIYGQF